MGFWKGLAKVAVGIAAPGALAGWEYQEAKQKKEMLSELDDANNTLFKTASMLYDKDGWSEVLVTLRSCVIEVLSSDESRTTFMEGTRAEELGRLCCQVALQFARNDNLKAFAESKGVDPDMIAGIFAIPLMYCEKLDERLPNCNLTDKELSVVRLAFDLGVTRSIPVVISEKGKTTDDSAALNNLLRDLFEEDAIKGLCSENGVDSGVIVGKLGL